MSTLLRPLLIIVAVLGVCHLAGVPVLDWALSLFQIVSYVIGALLWAGWQLLQPNQDQRHSSLPELHQAVLNVTSDASRVADLLEEFMAQYSSDPQLKAKFLTFMTQQADTKYSVVDNKLNWVLWMYSLIWMPLLVLMCLTRAGRGASAPEMQSVPTAAPYRTHTQLSGAHSGVPLPGQPLAPGAAPGPGLTPRNSGQMPDASAMSSNTTTGPPGSTGPPGTRKRLTTSASLDLPPRYSVPGSFGRPPGDGDVDVSTTRSAAASGRSLRQAMSGIAERQRQRASSDRTHMSRPSKLMGSGSGSVPPNVLLARGSSSGSGSGGSLKGGSSGRFVGGTAAPEYNMQAVIANGTDVRAAVAVDQAATGCGGEGYVAGWAGKGQALHGSRGPLVPGDAAAAADYAVQT